MSKIDELSQQLVDLETRMAFLEDTVETLNMTVFRKTEELKKLTQKNLLLTDQLKQIQATIEPNAEDEIPPHY